MTRVVLENVLLFLLPTLLYVGYVYFTREPGRGGTRVMDEAPLVWLFIAGAVLVIVTLVAFGSTSGGKPGQHYEPAVMKDGRIVPGHIE